MDIFTIILWILAIVALVMSLLKNKAKTFKSLTMAKGMMKNMFSSIFAILLFIGLLLSFVPPSAIQVIFNKTNVVFSTIIAAFVGGITLIPAFVAFPLVNSFTSVGVSIVPATAFLTTLTMVGFVTFPLEKKEFGIKFALMRNIYSFVFAIIIALIMGVILR
ncbi:permease [Clostridium sp. 'deep sea']|uniref:permease n=1 Tax=Clostridium sp. 'deep sea' TaxID=2779445 RepID=UPI00189652FC|nr:permease [Clostridium sp. 'deep sea']QOR34204.1 permease [Clostridium sp. 'deep sea']